MRRQNAMITSLHEKFRQQTEERRHPALSQSRTPGRGANAANLSDCGLTALVMHKKKENCLLA
jgi:hypothetical protein